MGKKNRTFLIVTTIITLIIIGLCTYAVFNHTTPLNENTNDTTEFIEEYESLNGIVREGYEYESIDLDLDDKAQIYYKTAEEISNEVASEDMMIYFGFSDCPWCRAMLESLISAVSDKDQVLYYVDLKEIRNTYEIVDGTLTETTMGSSGYYKLLEFAEEFLPDYNIKDGEEEVQTNTKRIYAPTIITVKDGKVLDLFSPGSDNIEDPLSGATDKEANDMYTKFLKMINNLDIDTCNTSDAC